MCVKIVEWVKQNRTVILITFEVFWVLVFLIDRIGMGGSGEIPQFVYVNF